MYRYAHPVYGPDYYEPANLPDPEEPTCDECGLTADEADSEWCGNCGTCGEHCEHECYRCAWCYAWCYGEEECECYDAVRERRRADLSNERRQRQKEGDW